MRNRARKTPAVLRESGGDVFARVSTKYELRSILWIREDSPTSVHPYIGNILKQLPIAAACVIRESLVTVSDPLHVMDWSQVQ